jgi:hypothetical protein
VLHSESVDLEPGLHGALFLNLFKIDISKFQKIRKKYLHVDNDDFYWYEKNQRKIFYILGCVKITNF